MLIENLDFMLIEVLAYYYKTEELGKREKALNLLPDEIYLNEKYPYYHLGLRGLSFESKSGTVSLYVDLYFITTPHYLCYYSKSCDYLKEIVVVSNESNLKNYIFNYNEKLSSFIELSGCNCIMLNSYLLHTDLHLLSESNMSLNFIESGYTISYDSDIDLAKIDEDIVVYNYLFSNLVFNRLFKIRFECDYLKVLEYLSLLLPKLNRNEYLDLVIEIKQSDMNKLNDYKSFIVKHGNSFNPMNIYSYKLSDLEDYKSFLSMTLDLLSYPDFSSLKSNLEKFHIFLVYYF